MKASHGFSKFHFFAIEGKNNQALHQLEVERCPRCIKRHVEISYLSPGVDPGPYPPRVECMMRAQCKPCVQTPTNAATLQKRTHVWMHVRGTYAHKFAVVHATGVHACVGTSARTGAHTRTPSHFPHVSVCAYMWRTHTHTSLWIKPSCVCAGARKCLCT